MTTKCDRNTPFNEPVTARSRGNWLDDCTPEEWDKAAAAARQQQYGSTPVPAPTRAPSAPLDFKAAQGIEKPRLDLIPLTALTYMALGLQEGARKYGSASWREVESVDLAQYVAATMRHLMAYADGEDVDPESGNPHIAHAMASLAIMVDLIESGTGADTRPATAGPGPSVISKYTRTT